MKKALMLIVFISSTAYSQFDYEVTGYLVDLPVYQHSAKELSLFTGIKQNSFLNISRFRIRPVFYLWDNARINIEYEINSIYFESTGQFNLLDQSGASRQLVDLSWNLTKENDFLSNHFIDRLYFKYNFSSANITVGRQRISWGTGRIWNPTDLFNPINPANFSKIEKDGADAVSFTWNAGYFTDLEMVFNPLIRIGDSNFGMRFRTNFGEYDVSLSGGRFDGTYVIGSDFAGNLFDAGVRGEGIYSFKSDKTESFVKFILGIDYQFTSKLYGLLEYQYNGLGKTDKLKYDLAGLINGEILNLNRNYFSGMFTYQYTPLIIISLSNLINVNDGSGYFGANVDYSLYEDFNLSLGCQNTFGEIFTEYWYYPDSYYLRLDYYF